MCPSGGYLEQILAQTEEICRAFDVDGLWYDINDGPYCYCDTCRAGMQAEGVSVDDADQVWAYNVRKWERMMRECNAVIREYHPDATVFYNGTTVLYSPDSRRPTEADTYRFNTQQELEDLPTTWGGYDKLAQRAKFFHNRGQDLLGHERQIPHKLGRVRRLQASGRHALRGGVHDRVRRGLQLRRPAPSLRPRWTRRPTG